MNDPINAELYMLLAEHQGGKTDENCTLVLVVLLLAMLLVVMLPLSLVLVLVIFWF